MDDEYFFRPLYITDYYSLFKLSLYALYHSTHLLFFIITFWSMPIGLLLYMILHKYLIAEHIPSKQVVGFVSYFKNPYKKQIEILYVAVKPKFRRKHIGKTLLKRAINDIKLNGFSDISITVKYENEPMRYLLESLGFEIKKGSVDYGLFVS